LILLSIAVSWADVWQSAICFANNIALLSIPFFIPSTLAFSLACSIRRFSTCWQSSVYFCWGMDFIPATVARNVFLPASHCLPMVRASSLPAL